jgi:hypothetical protein
MGTRIWLGLVTVFWVVMGVFLWRSEFGSRGQPGSVVPLEMVWQKILTAPDSSHLEIRHHTNRIGYCHWRPEVGQEIATGAIIPEEEPVEGMVHRLAHYTLDLEGNITLPGFPTRLRFSFGFKLSTNHAWQSFDTALTMRPDVYKLAANASEQTAHLTVDAGGDRIDRIFRFSEFQNPQKLLQEFGGPMFPALVTAMGVPLSTNQLNAAALGWRWEARNDSLLLGRNRVRAYRLQTKLVDRYQITIFVSPVGEILRAELPGNIVAVNDALAGLRQSNSHD